MTPHLSHPSTAKKNIKNKTGNHGQTNEKKKNSGNSKENNRSLSNITYSKRCIVIIHFPASCSELFFDFQKKDKLPLGKSNHTIHTLPSM